MNRYVVTTLGMLLVLLGAPHATRATPLYRVTDLGSANWGASLSLDDQAHISSNVIVGPGLMIADFIALECFEGREYSISEVQYVDPHGPGIGHIGGELYVGEIYGSNQADNALLGSSTRGDAFLARNGSVVDLNNQLITTDGHWWLQRADAMNSEGQIIGIGVNSQGRQDIFLLMPENSGSDQGPGGLLPTPIQIQTVVPEPSCLLLLLIGTSMLAVGCRGFRGNTFGADAELEQMIRLGDVRRKDGRKRCSCLQKVL